MFLLVNWQDYFSEPSQEVDYFYSEFGLEVTFESTQQNHKPKMLNPGQSCICHMDLDLGYV